MATPISKVTLTIDIKDYISGLQQAGNQTKTFGSDAAAAFNRADSATNKLNLSASNLTGGLLKLRGTLATIGLGAFATSALQSADAVADLADSTGMSIGKILEFQKALQLAGGKADDTGKALATFYGSIDEANQGSDKAQQTFAKLGVSLKDLRTLSEEDLLDKTIKGFNNLTDPIQRNTTLTDLFGKSMRTVDPGRLGDELESLRGTLAAQEGSTKDAADAIETFERMVSALKGAVVLAVQPLLQFFGVMKDNEIDVRAMAGAIQSLVAAYAAARVAAFTFAIAQAAAGAGLRGGIAGGVTAVAAAAATYAGLQELMDRAGAGAQPGQQGAGAGLGPNATMEQVLAEERRIREGRNRQSQATRREQELGKELQAQLTSVRGLADGYKRAAQANMDRYTTEVDLLGKTEYEQEIIKGTAEIEKRYADQTAALEEKKQGAKGATLALIQQSIKDLDGLRTSELDIFEITRKQTFEYKYQQEQVKLITDEIEKQIQRQQTLGDAIRSANDKRMDVTFEGTQRGRNPLERQIAEIQENARKGALEAGRTFSAAFEDGGDGLTPERAQELADGLNQIAEKYKGIADAQLGNLDASRTWDTGWKEAFDAYAENATNAATVAATAFSSMANNMESALDNFVETGKLNFGDLARSIIRDLLKIQLKAAAMNMFKAIGGSSVGTAISSFLGFAQGGMPPVGIPSIVGEQGPELFVPQSAGTIIPNRSLGGVMGSESKVTNTYNTYNISAVDAKSVAQLFSENRMTMLGNIRQAEKEMPFRGR
jgi:lambda family phage tail tape measure protein